MAKLEHSLLAHTPGHACVAYTPDAKYLLTVGSNNILRRYDVSATDEPVVIDTAEENTGLAATNDAIVACSEDGTVSLFTPHSTQSKLLTRTTLPARDVALSPDGAWAAVAADDAPVKVVNTAENTRIFTLREQSAGNKHVAFHPSGALLAVSCSDGAVYVYSVSTMDPELVTKVDGVIRALEGSNAEVTSKAAWHPDGRAFAAATATRDIVVVSRADWSRGKEFKDGHTADIADFAWSPTGAFLASAGRDGKLVIWESRTQKILASYDHRDISTLAWHPSENQLAFVTNQGWLHFLSDVVPEAQAGLLGGRLQPAPLAREATTAGRTDIAPRRRAPSVDSLDEILDLGPGGSDDGDDFLVDDDGAGYAEANPRKRRFGGDDATSAAPSKRANLGLWSPELHAPFQPTSTPWRAGRRYLCLNLVGFVWTVDQDSHHTVTVEFHDRGARRDFHFTDPWRFDKACLSETGALFSNQPSGGQPAVLYYRPHESWAGGRGESRIQLPPGEEVAALALATDYLAVLTGAGYLRVYTPHGMPVRVQRVRHGPAVAAAAAGNYLLTLANGPVAADGRASLVYDLVHLGRDEVLQSGDTVPLAPGGGGAVTAAFFSDGGDPCVFGSDGVLLALARWRDPAGARWLPLLDTRALAGPAREERYWPVAVAGDALHAAVLKGADRHPGFPRPLLHEFALAVPVGGGGSGGDGELERAYATESALLALAADAAGPRAAAAQRADLAARQNRVDKALLQIAIACCRDDDAAEKALEVCRLFVQRRTLDMAVRAAVRYGRGVLAEKITALIDERELDGEADE